MCWTEPVVHPSILLRIHNRLSDFILIKCAFCVQFVIVVRTCPCVQGPNVPILYNRWDGSYRVTKLPAAGVCSFRQLVWHFHAATLGLQYGRFSSSAKMWREALHLFQVCFIKLQPRTIVADEMQTRVVDGERKARSLLPPGYGDIHQDRD